VSSKKKIISIVDDDQDTSRLFHMVLSQQFAGYDVFSFNDSVLAVEHFTENQSAYALVITDFRMAGLNGLELLSKIKNANPKVRTIVISGINFENQMFRDCMELGIIDLTIAKPVTIQQLCLRLRGELEIYQSENLM
jgi:DNA-binding NtrC family response regulator